jgi:hypothetical protein
MNEYETFLAKKQILAQPSGFDVATDRLNQHAFDYQKAIVHWALRRGKAAIFSRYGTGKTLMQLDWADQVVQHTGGDVLILAPLAVARQTQQEGQKFGIDVTVCRTPADLAPGINVTNYELLHKFDLSRFVGVVLDESSILKHIASKTRGELIDALRHTPYKLCCTATPSPNDHVELGGHAEFLGVMSQSEMLATFFHHDGGDTSKWYLKQHARTDFWRWVASWAVMLRTPADLGYSDDRFQLPPLRMHEHVVASNEPTQGFLFAVEALTLTERRGARRESLEERVAVAAALANNSTDQWLIWCNLNDEGAALERAIPGAVNVQGSDSAERKAQAMADFVDGRLRVLVSKPSICGFGMNFQNCHQMAFVGLSDSFEEMDQALHRCYRYGQTEPVDCHVIVAETEGAVVRNIERKRAANAEMADELVQHIAVHYDASGLTRSVLAYQPRQIINLPTWLRSEAA